MAEALPSAPPTNISSARRSWRLFRRVLAALAISVGLLVLLAAGAALWLRIAVRASLPQLDGERRIQGLAAPVVIERDDLGVPTIRAASQLDASRALGFLHGQDRFFQMDLLRRQAAGELAEILGPAAVDMDFQHRVHRFRERARFVLSAASPGDRALLAAYAEGVASGLAALRKKPFEYLALRVDPVPWRPEDSLLAIYAMFLELNQETWQKEGVMGNLRDSLPKPLFDFLTPVGTEWDAPDDMGPALAQLPIPGPEVLDLRRRPALPQAARLDRDDFETLDEEAAAGSVNSPPNFPPLCTLKIPPLPG